MTRVLLADDHAIIRDGVKQLFADTDDLVVAGEAANGVDALRHVAEHHYDVIVLDLSMPGRSGIDLIRQIKAVAPNTPVLVFTMHQEEQYALRSIHAGASGYLTKESGSELLVAAVRRLAAGGVHVSEKVTELMLRERMPRGDALPHTLLSDREFQVFALIVAGQSLTRIANDLSLSVKTVSTHKTHILQKMGMTSQADLVRYAMTHGLYDTPQ